MASAPYKIVITYCNEITFDHHHDDIAQATKEYIELLSAVIEQSSVAVMPEHPTNHIMMVSLMFYEDDHIRTTINSGVFSCEHQATVQRRQS